MTVAPADRLRDHLIATGVTTANRVARAARIGACRHCHAVVVRGLDADMAGLEVAVDPTPVDELGELLAVTADRATYDAVTAIGRLELNPRDQPGHLIRPRRYPVLAEHRCGRPLPTVTNDRDDATRQEIDEPPF